MSKVVYSQRWEWQTRLPFPSLTVYKIKKNLENVPRNLDDLKYRGTFILFIYSMLRDKKRKSRKRTPKIKEIHILGYLDHNHIQYVTPWDRELLILYPGNQRNSYIGVFRPWSYTIRCTVRQGIIDFVPRKITKNL